MTLTLNLGVVDIPYADPPSTTGKAASRNVTTGDVAGFLENKYHVMEVFYRENERRIADLVADSLSGAMENALAGAPAGGSPFASAEAGIDKLFKDFIALDVMATLGYPGVPTMAALEGKSSRFKKGKGPPRPSFYDTGAYVNAQKNWFEGWT